MSQELLQTPLSGLWADMGARMVGFAGYNTVSYTHLDVYKRQATGFIKPIDGMKIALSASSSERIPTETELFADGPHAATQSFEIGNPNLKIEGAKSIELGLKY